MQHSIKEQYALTKAVLFQKYEWFNIMITINIIHYFNKARRKIQHFLLIFYSFRQLQVKKYICDLLNKFNI